MFRGSGGGAGDFSWLMHNHSAGFDWSILLPYFQYAHLLTENSEGRGGTVRWNENTWQGLARLEMFEVYLVRLSSWWKFRKDYGKRKTQFNSLPKSNQNFWSNGESVLIRGLRKSPIECWGHLLKTRPGRPLFYSDSLLVKAAACRIRYSDNSVLPWQLCHRP